MWAAGATNGWGSLEPPSEDNAALGFASAGYTSADLGGEAIRGDSRDQQTHPLPHHHQYQHQQKQNRQQHEDHRQRLYTQEREHYLGGGTLYAHEQQQQQQQQQQRQEEEQRQQQQQYSHLPPAAEAPFFRGAQPPQPYFGNLPQHRQLQQQQQQQQEPGQYRQQHGQQQGLPFAGAAPPGLIMSPVANVAISPGWETELSQVRERAAGAGVAVAAVVAFTGLHHVRC